MSITFNSSSISDSFFSNIFFSLFSESEIEFLEEAWGRKRLFALIRIFPLSIPGWLPQAVASYCLNLCGWKTSLFAVSSSLIVTLPITGVKLTIIRKLIRHLDEEINRVLFYNTGSWNSYLLVIYFSILTLKVALLQLLTGRTGTPGTNWNALQNNVIYTYSKSQIIFVSRRWMFVHTTTQKLRIKRGINHEVCVVFVMTSNCPKSLGT